MSTQAPGTGAGEARTAPARTENPSEGVSIGLIGYGEVGQIFAGTLARAGHRVSAWDLKLHPDHPDAGTLGQVAAAAGVQVCSSMQGLCDAATLIISAVTASRTLDVAREAAAHVQDHHIFLDLNSASPGTKIAAAAALQARGARYVEAGVMTSVPPYGVAVPMLLGGPHAQAVAPMLATLGLKFQVASERLGVASATKMCRSIMIKGLEALVVESFSTARHYGVEDAMLATLAETFPDIDWQRQGAYLFSRVVQHGRRRAEEMRESALTAQEAGMGGLMAAAIAERQQSVADAAAHGVFTGLDRGLPAGVPWQAYADRLLAHWPAPSRPLP